MKLDYENLEVITLARQLTKRVYNVTSKWPKEELYSGGLGNQARRASVSVVLNIAEGSPGTNKEFARFVRIATRSLVETREALILAKELGYYVEEENEENFVKLFFKLKNLQRSLF